MPSLFIDEDQSYSRKSLREEQRERIRKAIEDYLPCQNVSAKRTLNEMIDHLVQLVQDETFLGEQV